MEHHGEKLRGFIKAKGFNISELAQGFGLTRAAVDKHVRSERLTRKVLKPYAELLDFPLDTFFEEIDTKDIQAQKKPEHIGDVASTQTGSVPAEIHSQLQREYFDLQKRYNELVIRFFPSAAQLV